MRKFSLLAALCLILTLLVGCDTLSEGSGGDLKDVELAAALTLDKAVDGKIAAGVWLLHRDKALERQYAESYYSLSAAGAGTAEAVAALYAEGARQPNFSHTALLVIGEDAAELENWLDYAVRQAQLRPTLYPVICRGEAAALFAAGEAAVSPVYLLENALEPLGSGYPGAAAVTLQEFLEALFEPGIAPVLPLAEKSAAGVRLAGLAVYDDGGWQFLPEGNAAFCWRLLRHPQHIEGETLALPAGLSLAINDVNVFYRLAPADPPLKPVLKVEVSLRAAVLNDPQDIGPAEIERLAAARLRQIFAAGLSESRRLGLDLLGVGRELHRKLPEFWQAASGRDYLNEIAAALVPEVTVEMN